MAREHGYLYEVTLKAMVELTLSPSTPKKKLREALYDNAQDYLTMVDTQETKENGAKLTVTDWELLERRPL